MTNKIKPFCVDTKAENLSNEHIKQLHKWCVDAGGRGYDDENNWLSDKNGFPLMGIDYDKDIISRVVGGLPYFDNNIIKFQDVPSYLGLTEEVDNEENIPVETSVSPSDSFYTKLSTLLAPYPISISRGHTEASESITVTHTDFENNFIVECEEDLLELLEAFDTLYKLVER